MSYTFSHFAESFLKPDNMVLHIKFLALTRILYRPNVYYISQVLPSTRPRKSPVWSHPLHSKSYTFKGTEILGGNIPTMFL